MPAAEVTVDVVRVRAMLREQHPDLAELPLERVSNGWDNAIFRLGPGHTVRVPRRRAAVDLILNEQRWLPHYAAATAVPVPAPLRTGRASDLFPWPWSVNPWFDGDAALRCSPAERGALAVPLAGFLADIHRAAPSDVPRNPVRGVPLASRDDAFRRRLPATAIRDAAAVLALWEHLASVPSWQGPPLWLHGDLHPANILHRGGALTAVIDFGDLTSGDPATDLATAWLTFDAAGRRAFRAEVTARCGTDDDTWRRARGWALNIATALLAHSDDNPAFLRLGQHALGEVLADG